MKKLSKSQKAEVDKLDASLPESAEAEESGYHAPSSQDVEDIRHDHNTAGAGAITADEAVREVTDARERQKIEAHENDDAFPDLYEQEGADDIRNAS